MSMTYRSNLVKFTKINQTLIKKIVTRKYDLDLNFFGIKDYCPWRIYLEDIAKIVCRDATEAQYRGLFFESNLLGASAKGKSFLDIHLSKTGKVPIDYTRILKQVDNAKIVFLQNGVQIFKGINCQIPLALWNEDLQIWHTGELDVFPTSINHEGEIKKTIMDLKLTKDTTSTYSEWGWGDTTHMDFLQADMYTDMVLEIFNNPDNIQRCKEYFKDFDYSYIFSYDNIEAIRREGILFYYFIFGYTDNETNPLSTQKKIIERVRTPEKRYEYLARLTYAVDLLRIDEAKGWQTNPFFDVCKDCPAKDTYCKDYKILEQV